MKIEPYPLEWPRRLDFLPPRKVQAKIDPQLELFFCDAKVSTSVSLPKDGMRTEYGMLELGGAAGTQAHYIKGDPDPLKKEIEPVTQKEILKDVTRFMGEAEDDAPGVVIKARGIVEDIPNTFSIDELLQGSEHIYRLENGEGNYNKMLRRRLGYNLMNPYKIMKNELLAKGIIRNPFDPVFKQIRSTLKTAWLITDRLGWKDLGGNKIPRLDAALSFKKWWEDEGNPIDVIGTADHTLIKGIVYHLKHKNRFMVV